MTGAINNLEKTLISIIVEKEKTLVSPFEDRQNIFEKVPYTQYIKDKYGEDHEYMLLGVNAEGSYVYHKEWDNSKNERGTLFDNHKQALVQLIPCGTRSASSIWDKNRIIEEVFKYVYNKGSLKTFN